MGSADIVPGVSGGTIALITGLGELYNFDTTIIVGTITLIATFLGALLGVSNYNYKKEGK